MFQLDLILILNQFVETLHYKYLLLMAIAISAEEMFVILFAIHHGHFLPDCLQVCWAQ